MYLYLHLFNFNTVQYVPTLQDVLFSTCTIIVLVKYTQLVFDILISHSTVLMITTGISSRRLCILLYQSRDIILVVQEVGYVCMIYTEFLCSEDQKNENGEYNLNYCTAS